MSTFFCEKDRETGEFDFIFPDKFQVKMCGVNNKDIVEVKVEEVDGGSYWAYFDTKEKEYRFIYPSKRQVQLCSPDFFERAIDSGEGVIVNIDLVEV